MVCDISYHEKVPHFLILGKHLSIVVKSNGQFLWIYWSSSSIFVIQYSLQFWLHAVLRKCLGFFHQTLPKSVNKPSLLGVYESDHGKVLFPKPGILKQQTSILFNRNSVQQYLNVYFKEASMVQTAEMEIDFLFFSCLAAVLVKEICSTVLHVYTRSSWYVCNTWLCHSALQTTSKKYFTGEASSLSSEDRDRKVQTFTVSLRSLNISVTGEGIEVCGFYLFGVFCSFF